MNPTFLKQTFWTLAAGLSLLGAACGPPVLAADTLVISEFMAANSSTLADEDGSFEDWIEVHNVSPAPLDLLNWALTDRSDRLAQWRFPSTNLPPGGYLVVFASGKDRRVPGARLHTNFKLSAGGEYLALVEPDGLTVATEFPPPFAPQLADISYGFGAELTSSLVLDGAAAVRYLIPPDGRLGTTWTLPGFDDTSWTQGTNGLGYETGPPEFPLTTLIYSNLIRTDLGAAMANVNASALFRFPFVITNLARLQRLVLRMKYDDGFAAYVNGQPAVAMNAPAALEWNSAATQRHSNTLAIVFEEFELTELRGNLVIGTNVLAIHGLNFGSTNPDFLILPELAITTSGSLTSTPRYFRQPTPGRANGSGSSDVGPILSQVSFTPALPARPDDNNDITVTARVSPAFSPVIDLRVRYRVMFGATNTLAMLDDGQHGDGAAGDGVYGAVIPASASAPGQMVRFQIAASDQAGQSSRWPWYEDTNNSPAWLGTVVANPAVTSALPIWEWFAEDTVNVRNRIGARGSVLFNGEFMDQVFIRERGGFTSIGSQKFDFNPGQHLKISEEIGRVEEANLNNNPADPSHARPALCFDIYRAARSPASVCFPILMRLNGTPDRVANYVEQVDERFLERRGLPRDGALYKFVQRAELTPGFDDVTDGVEKKTRMDEDRSDILAISTVMKRTSEVAARAAFLFDNFDLPSLANFFAVRAITRNIDCVRKNFYFYRDTDAHGEWTVFPWDMDLTFGTTGDLDHEIHPFHGDIVHRWLNPDQWNWLWEALFNDPRTRPMLLRRMRTVMDEQLGPVGYLESRVNAFYATTAPHFGADVAAEVEKLKQAIAQRRTELYVTYAVTNLASTTNAIIPQAQPLNTLLRIVAIDANPSSGRQAEEFVCLSNTAPFAADISGWRLAGAVDHVFRPGTVIGSNSLLFISPNVTAFRSRTTGPRGGQTLFVQGNYQGTLSARGETLELRDAADQTIDTFSSFRDAKTVTFVRRCCRTPDQLEESLIAGQVIEVHPVTRQVFRHGHF